MKHYIDLDSNQLIRLHNLVFDRKDMKDITDKRHSYIQIIKSTETFNTKEK